MNEVGYKCANVDGNRYLVHRLIYLYHEGYLPVFVDHIDHNKLNNNIDNLRDATFQGNTMNTGLRSTNTSGVKGVGWCKALSKWHGQVMLDGKQYHVGYFVDIEEATIAVISKRDKLHGKYSSHG